MRIEQINEIKTQYNEELQRYMIVLNKDYKLSVLTGSHYDSSECGTLEIALLKNDKWAFGGENTESAIIDYISIEEADKMVSEMRSGNIEEIFLKYKYGEIFFLIKEQNMGENKNVFISTSLEEAERYIDKHTYQQIGTICVVNHTFETLQCRKYYRGKLIAFL